MNISASSTYMSSFSSAQTTSAKANGSQSASAAKAGGAQNTSAAKAAQAEKPAWDGKKVYTYLEDFNDAIMDYGKRAQKYYSNLTAKDGEMSVEELKKQISEWFPQYTLTDREPRDVVAGKHYLYIDESQLKKMAADAEYRGKVYGLMEREYTPGSEFTLKYSDGKNVTKHITGSVFSLCEKNRKYAGPEGIPYLGSCMSDHPWSSSQSHCQVRNQSFIYDHLDPAKSAARERKAAAVKQEAEKRLAAMREKKKLQKAQQEAKAEKKKEAEKAAEKKAESKRRQEELLSDDGEIGNYDAAGYQGFSVSAKSVDYSI